MYCTNMLKFNIRKEDVMMLLSLLILKYRNAGFTIRKDNGSQYVATMDREFLKEKVVIQEFTHWANLRRPHTSKPSKVTCKGKWSTGSNSNPSIM
jgi:hypothetical protein